MMLMLLLACTDDVPAPAPAPVDSAEPMITEPSDPPLLPLDSPRLLRRISLDLRGVVPTSDELDAVEADPSVIESYRDDWLDDPRLESRVVELLGEQWHTRVDAFNVGTVDYNLSDEQEYALERAIGEEPLRLVAHVVLSDAHYSEIVTADYTRSDALLLSLWPLQADDPSASGWQTARYTDGRPPAGVLVTNGLWWRYWTTNFNYNRARAAAMMRILVCEDLLQREVSFSNVPALVDEDGTETAIRESPACVNCHSVLDPAAANLFGFWWYDLYDVAEMTAYHPERELLYETYLDITPAWAGQPVSGLADLGETIAADPRFTRCAVETFTKGLWRRELGLSDFAWLDALHGDFIDADQRVRPLLAAIIDTPTYRAGELAADATDADDSREMLLRPLSPGLLASAIADLTGFVWTHQGDQRMDEDSRGFRIMAGGVDGLQVIAPQADASVTSVLVTRRLAEAAAQTASGELFDGELTPSDAAFHEQLSALHWRLYGVRADEDWLAEITDLWTALSEEDTESAWIAVVATMLQDPLFVTR